LSNECAFKVDPAVVPTELPIDPPVNAREPACAGVFTSPDGLQLETATFTKASEVAALDTRTRVKKLRGTQSATTSRPGLGGNL
jgi:hypothetical protein